MTVEQLIAELQKQNPDAEVQYKGNALTTDAVGFTKSQRTWVPLKPDNIYTTRFGGNTVFIGEK